MSDQHEPLAGDLLVILRHAPHGSSWLREGLDVALVAAAFGTDVSLLFMGEGVTALVEDQTAGALGQKGTAPTLEMLEMYDIETLWVEAEALTRFGLTADELMLAPRALEAGAIAEAVQNHPRVLTF
ncbi:sulfurtransferase complex subunit TusC [Halomonas sp. ND22Bw]|uniref:Multidrug transporter n=1 Tax=Halomonas salina TaxID=42565 RepID=A0ABR4WWF0_9GAMM|nr:sulfurtransferase complex subunit TusC [Halomonas salina]KGE79050.1 multidrug transporter [Halomonas salina]PSJ23426.1 sulfurtransferase complex subunit TusC [Halomonas sp. ND22Bw]